MGANLNVRLDVSGLENGTFLSRIEDAIVDALDKGAALVANSAKENHPKVLYQSTAGAAFGGATTRSARAFLDDRYRVPNPDGTMRFLTRTGNLVQSIYPVGAKRVSGGFKATVVSGMDYSDKVEFGDVTSRPFPFMRPAIELNRENIKDLLHEAVRGGIGG